MHLILCCVCLSAGAIPETTVTTRGTWILNERGEAVEPVVWKRGLQTSGLTFTGKKLIAVGDQRSNVPAHLLPLRTPETNPEKRETRLATAPIGIVPGKALLGPPIHPVLRAYLRKPNPDFEGLTHDPHRENTFYAVIEMDGSYLLEIAWRSGEPQATIERIVGLKLPDAAPWRGDPNYRLEGIAVTGPGPELVLAFERMADELPRLAHVVWKPGRKDPTITARLLPISFESIPRRPGKGLLNVNGLAHVADHVLLIARDQERILVVNAKSHAIERIVNVNFLSPTGEKLMWTSPEGIAVDTGRGLIYIVSDPDSMRGNYRRLADGVATGRFAQLVPLLFTIPLAAILPDRADREEKKTR